MRPDERVPEPVDRPDERHDELIRWRVVQLPRRGGLLDPAAVEDDDTVGDLHRLLLIVCDDHCRRTRLVVQPPQPLAQLLADARVECTERLVEKEHIRVDGERAGEAHPLPLAAGELRRIPLRQTGQLHELEQLGDAGADLAARAPPDRQAEGDVVPNSHVLEGRVVLEDETDAARLGRLDGCATTCLTSFCRYVTACFGVFPPPSCAP